MGVATAFPLGADPSFARGSSTSTVAVPPLAAAAPAGMRVTVAALAELDCVCTVSLPVPSKEAPARPVDRNTSVAEEAVGRLPTESQEYLDAHTGTIGRESVR